MAPSNLSIMFAVSIREGGKTEKNSFKEKQNGIIFRLTECIILDSLNLNLERKHGSNMIWQ